MIILSWMQKLFQRFRNDEEETFEENVIHNEEEERPYRTERRKDLETRITYQYPKGHFRFPIIPDNNMTNNQQNRTSDNHESRNFARTQTSINDQKSMQNDQAKTEKKTSSHLHNGRPFHPTETASPVFGYHRPKETPVAYELSDFSGEIQNVHDYPTANREKAPENDQIGDAADKDETNTKTVPYSTEEFIQTAEQIPCMIAAALRKEEAGGQNASDVTCAENSADPIRKEILDEAEPPKEETAAVLMEEQPILDEGPNLTSNDSPASMEQKLWKETEKEEALAEKDAAEFSDGIGNTDTQEPELSEQTQLGKSETAAVMEKTAVLPDDPGQIGSESPHPEELSNHSDARSSFDQHQNPKPESVEPSRPKQRHLPFNVLMLKQDKQKWEERKNPLEPFQESLPKQASEMIQPDGKNNQENSSVDLRGDHGTFEFPGIQLLNPPVSETVDSDWLNGQENLLNQTLQNFNVGAKVVNVTQGPSVTRFEVHPEPGVKVNKVTNLTDDIKLSLAARDIRIEAPIPGKHTIGIEVPNQTSRPVQISEIIGSKIFQESVSPLTAVLGLDISGKPIVTDLKKMPHGLIAGATGSGKSVCINSILVSLLYKASPDELKLLLIDPKMVELAPYNRIPHLVSPVITDVKAATAALQWAVDEMERRYELFAHTGVRDINRFNVLAMKHGQYADKLPFIVIVIDELADLMMMAPADVEEAICRIAQKARACGIHLIIATQRPSVDVITGLIKANIPTRIAFSVSSQVDSRTIIDISGAEKLLGRGDMLFLENGASKPVRLQGTFVSDEEIDLVVEHTKKQSEPHYLFEQEELLKKAQVSEEDDELFYEACEFVVNQASASTSSLQRRFKIGYNRAARLMDMMEQQGYISEANGSKSREVFLTDADLESIQESGLSGMNGQ